MKKNRLLDIIDTTVEEYMNEDGKYSFGVKQQESTGRDLMLDAGQRDGFFTGIQTSASHITDAAKVIGAEFDALNHEEKRVLGKDYYRKFLIRAFGEDEYNRLLNKTTPA